MTGPRVPAGREVADHGQTRRHRVPLRRQPGSNGMPAVIVANVRPAATAVIEGRQKPFRDGQARLQIVHRHEPVSFEEIERQHVEIHDRAQVR